MTKKEQHPAGVKLTAKTARTLAMQEFGTARGLTKSTSFVGVYFMEFGNLRIEICADAACIVVRVVLAYPETPHGEPGRFGQYRGYLRDMRRNEPTPEEQEVEEMKQAARVIKKICDRRTADDACSFCPFCDMCRTEPYTWEVTNVTFEAGETPGLLVPVLEVNIVDNEE